MIDSAALLADLRAQLKVLTADLRAQAEDPTVGWARQLRAQSVVHVTHDALSLGHHGRLSGAGTLTLVLSLQFSALPFYLLLQ